MLTEEDFRATNLCVVGNINRDIKTSPIAPGHYLFEDGETSVGSITETVGGGGTNSALAAASLGAQVAFLGKVGADALGSRLEQCLRSHGVIPHLKKSAGCSTGTSINLTFTTNRRHFVSSLPNNASLALEDIDLEVLTGFRHLLRADIWFSEAMLYGGNERLLQHARSLGMKVSMDLNWDPHWGISSPAEIRKRKEAIRRVLPLVDLAHGNIRELNEFADSTDLSATLRALERWGAEAVVVHMGEGGAGYFHNGEWIVEPPVLARQQVNTTGTGDVLSVCMMLLDQHRESTIAEKLRLANRIVSEFMEGKRTLIPPL